MFEDNIEKIKESKLLSISIQSSLLGLNVILASQKIYNSFLLLSIALLFSLFLLQASSHRFLYFNPGNNHVKKPTPHIDTYILYVLIYLAGVLFVLGITYEYKIESLNLIEQYFKSIILWLYLFVVPIFWKVFGRQLVAKSIANKLKDKSHQYIGNCNQCGGKQTLYENIVISWNDLRIKRTCPNCDKEGPSEIKIPSRIG